MPLEKGAPGSAAFKHNIETEMNAGKSQKQAVAIAYSQAGERHDGGHDTARLDALLDQCTSMADRVDALCASRV